MATYYVRTTGSDSAAGTSAATAWLTIGKAMGTAGAADGDTVYVGAGTYRITTTIAPTSMASMTYLYGDTDGSKTGDAGEVIVTNYTSDTSAPAAIDLFTLASKSYWTLGKLTLFQGHYGTSYVVFKISGSSANLTFQDLTILCGNTSATLGAFDIRPTAATVLNLTVERCRFQGGENCLYFVLPQYASPASDTNTNTVIRNNVMISGSGVYLETSGSGTYRSGGFSFLNNHYWGTSGTGGFLSNATSTTHKSLVYNNYFGGYRGPYAAPDTNRITEDYNVINCTVPRTNVTAGANSKSDQSRNWRFSQSHETAFGGVTRPYGEFPAGSPLLTWGGTAVPTDDINGITRPASGASQTTTQQALGPFERANSAIKETTTTRTGGTAIKIAGPGYQDFELAVTPGTANVVVWSYKDAAYGTAATGPQLIVTNGGEAGYGGTTITSAGSTAAWAAMTATITPTSAGIVTVRLQSNATVGTANVYFDDFSVT